MASIKRRENGQFAKDEVEERPEPAVVDEEEREVEIDDEPEDDPDDEPAEAAPDPNQPNRRAKKQKRLQELRAADERRVQERIDAAEAARREAEAQAAYARGVLEQQARQQQGPQEDPLEAEIKRSQKRQLELQSMFEAMTPEQQAAKKAEMEAEYIAEGRKEKEAIAEIVARRNGAGRQPDPMAGVRQHLLTKHAADILASPPNVQRYGIAIHQALTSQGYPDNEETLVLAAQRTREAFPQLFPQAAQRRVAPQPRSTMMSVRSTGGPPVNGGGERRTVKMNAQLRGLARAAYPNLPAEQAIKKWAKDHDEWRQKHPEDEHVKDGG